MPVTVRDVGNYFDDNGVSARSIESFFKTYGFTPETILAYFKVVDDLPFPAGPVIPRPIRKELLLPLCPGEGVLWEHRENSHWFVFSKDESDTSYARRKYDAPKAKIFIPSLVSWLTSKNLDPGHEVNALLRAISLIASKNSSLAESADFKDIKKSNVDAKRNKSSILDKNFYASFEGYTSISAQSSNYENESPEFKRRLVARVFYCAARSWIKPPDKTKSFDDEKHLTYILTKALRFIKEKTKSQQSDAFNNVFNAFEKIFNDMHTTRWRSDETTQIFLDTGVKEIDDHDLNIKRTMPESHIPGILAKLNTQGFSANHMWEAYFLAGEVVSLLTDPALNYEICSDCRHSFAKFFERINNKASLRLKQIDRHPDSGHSLDSALWIHADNMRKVVSYYFGWKPNQSNALGSFPAKPIHFCICQH